MNVCRLRTERGLTQDELAALVDIDRRHMQRIEAGLVFAGGFVLLELCAALEVSVDEVLHGVPRRLADLKRMQSEKTPE